jgi:hypothetical protein
MSLGGGGGVGRYRDAYLEAGRGYRLSCMCIRPVVVEKKTLYKSYIGFCSFVVLGVYVGCNDDMGDKLEWGGFYSDMVLGLAFRMLGVVVGVESRFCR